MRSEPTSVERLQFLRGAPAPLVEQDNTPLTALENERTRRGFWRVSGLIAGVVMSLIQIVTSIQDAAFSTVPRLVAFLVGIMLLLPWMLMKLMAFTTSIVGDLPRFAR